MTECQKPIEASKLRSVMCLQFVKNDNNGILQTEVTYGESTYYKRATDLDLHEAAAVKRQRTVEFNSGLKNKLNEHAAEQSEKLSDLKELQSMKLQKLQHWTQLNVKENVTCTRCSFSASSFSTKLPKKSSLQV